VGDVEAPGAQDPVAQGDVGEVVLEAAALQASIGRARQTEDRQAVLDSSLGAAPVARDELRPVPAGCEADAELVDESLATAPDLGPEARAEQRDAQSVAHNSSDRCLMLPRRRAAYSTASTAARLGSSDSSRNRPRGSCPCLGVEWMSHGTASSA
jgi:hypothetical protein